MTMTRRTLLAAAAVAALAAAAHAEGGSPLPAVEGKAGEAPADPRANRPHHPSREGFLRRMDTDGDGSVSKEEFLRFHAERAEEAFDRFDRDGDGSISAEDLPDRPGRSERRQKRAD